MKRTIVTIIASALLIAGTAYAQVIYSVVEGTSVPARKIFVPTNNTPKDLFLNMQNEIEKRIAKVTGNMASASVKTQVKSLFTRRDIAGNTWVRNNAPGNQLWTNIDGELDFTGHSPWNNAFGDGSGATPYYGSGTLISPRHLVFATHQYLNTNRKFRFVTKDNQVIERTMTAKIDIPPTNIGGSDITIGVLDSDVPDTIAYYPVLSKEEWRQAFKDEKVDSTLDNRLLLPTIALDAADHASIKATSKYSLYGESNSLTASSPLNQKFIPFTKDVIVGDSGNPIFVVVGGQLVLISHWTTNGSGPSYAHYHAAINEAMTRLGGGYQLSGLNTSNFTSGATLPIPTVKMTPSFSLTTDKPNYKSTDTVNITSSFSINPEWVTWLKSRGKNTIVLRTSIRNNLGVIIVTDEQVIPVQTGAISKTVAFPPPAGVNLAGKTYTVNVVLAEPEFVGDYVVPPIVFSYGTELPIAVSVNGAGTGKVTATGIDCGTDCTEVYPARSTVVLTAVPADGSEFGGWSGGTCTGTSLTCSVSMTALSITVNATFNVANRAPVAQGSSHTTTGAPLEITLTANDTPGDTLTFAPTTLSTPLATLTRVREGVYRYTLKTPLPTVRSTDTFTFTASDGRLTSAPATVSVVFTPTPPTQFSLNTSVVGSGKITGVGIDCGLDCSERINTGTPMTLTATPAEGYTFTGWSGACANTTPNCSVSITQDRSVTATFVKQNTAPITQPINVITDGTPININFIANDAEGGTIRYNVGAAPGRGTLTRVSEGVYTYTPNTPLPTTAYTDGFNYNATDGSLTSPATRVTIQYTPPQYVLTVSKSVNGKVNGTGIDCGTDCTESLNINSTNVLTATPVEGYTFTGWSGACTNTTGACTVMMSQNRNVTATFTQTNTAPVAQNGAFSTANGVANITLTATDAQGDALEYAIVRSPANGTLNRVSEGRYQYITRAPLPASITSDSFTFTATDKKLVSNVAEVKITIVPTTNPNPVPPDADKDGVADAYDLCANTPVALKAKVNAAGCVRPRLTKFDIKPNVEGGIKNLSNVALGKTNVAKIEFKQPISLARDTEELDVDSVVLISSKKIQVDSTRAPELNKQAVLTFYGLTEVSPKILRDGVECPSTICKINSYSGSTLVVTVTSFSIYEVVEGAQNNNTAPVVTNISLTGSTDSDVVSVVLTGTDAQGNTLTYSVDGALLNKGVVALSGNTATYTYTGGDRGGDVVETFTYKANDGRLDSNIGNVTITIPKKTIVQTVVEAVTQAVTRRRGGGGGGSRTSTNTQTTTPASPTITNVFTRTISVGASGADVKVLQQRLNTLGYTVAASGAGSRGKETTFFGQATQAALTRYQRAKGIPVTGTLDLLTQLSLSTTVGTGSTVPVTTPVVVPSTPVTTPAQPTALTSFTRDLRTGSSGADVKRLQQILNAQGFTIATTGIGSAGNESTYFGAKTAAALLRFQRAKGLPAVGWVGPKTRAFLNALPSSN